MNQNQIKNLSSRLGWLKFQELPGLADIGQGDAVQRSVASIKVHAEAADQAFQVGDLVSGLAQLEHIADRFVPAIVGELGAALDRVEAEHRERAKPLCDRAASLIFTVGEQIAERRGAIRMGEARACDEEARLRGAGLTPEQVAKVGAGWTDADRQRIEAEIATLEAERTALGAFVADGPRFDVALLVGTRLAQAIEPAALAV